MKAHDLLLGAVAHATATAAVIGLSVGFSVIGYFGLLAWSILTGSPLGGPLGLLAMMFAAFVLSSLAAVVVLAPVTMVTSAICARGRNGWRLLQIPVAMMICLGELLAISSLIVLIARNSGNSALDTIRVAVVAWLILLFPLGVYWWILQAHAGVHWAVRTLWTRLRSWRKRPGPSQVSV